MLFYNWFVPFTISHSVFFIFLRLFFFFADEFALYLVLIVYSWMLSNASAVAGRHKITYQHLYLKVFFYVY